MVTIKDVKDAYERYGFTLNETEDATYAVFSIVNGYFENFEIVPLCEDSRASKAYEEYQRAGLACKLRDFDDVQHVESLLFNGFFAVEATKRKLINDYNKFANAIVAPYGDAQYEYLSVPFVIDGLSTSDNLVRDVVEHIKTEKPTLFLIEAAAGFGKTCTAQEIVKELISIDGNIPLFAELSRYRQARVFRHILLEEIDRLFPHLNSRVVYNEIVSGRVIPVLDGFDELLRESAKEDGEDFIDKEPMLETIGDFLKGRAKIVITTRRTILFDGDDFHQWLDKNQQKFDVIKIKIGEPRIKDWLSLDRINALEEAGLEIDHIANPVLLSYLKCINMDMFSNISKDPEKLVASYFDFMMNREMVRQDLLLDVDQQSAVLTSIAADMVKYQYTSEDRDYIVSFIMETQSDLIDDVLQKYPSDQKPTRDAIANKLASHALLDKNARNPNKIGFINDFVMGNFVANDVLINSDWLCDDWRFIEAAAISYQSRSKIVRGELFRKLSPSLEFVGNAEKVDASLRLCRSIPFPLLSGSIEDLSIENAIIGQCPVKVFQFVDCKFISCQFNFKSLSNVTFLNCSFFACEVISDECGENIHFLGSYGEFQHLVESASSVDVLEHVTDAGGDQEALTEKIVLERFWPVGRERIYHKHRPIKGICASSSEFSTVDMYSAIIRLKQKNILVEPKNPAFVEINIEMITEIKNILGRA